MLVGELVLRYMVCVPIEITCTVCYAASKLDINVTNGETCIVFGVHGFSMGFELRTIWRWWKIE